ncbi:hypothetical protein [Lacrimispora saccharolytica]|uniref:Ethanolamine utilization cobalamin adenosyltransferase n=1 Tax=Lacrimispora saccharolytica (strain ATCC 35040 / DSM 2544 / NRCC 2533 / WM1) TaxID=610130 RepID=D9R9Q0_LACSW|nr:hypothetical protein [Lacrimispora saccharolytica]ADL04100.1 conserved hypothetical protein [[Clostridium] saccharolyticum WM1]QRV21607.1 hypothetical protein I6K70_09265 [Lacrimispora saccharolytica]
MAILTESNIKRLLRTTNLKETKYLVLDPGTVITPSAKEYLKDITIEYRKIPEASETKTQDAAFPMTHRLTYEFEMKINIAISHIVTLQKKSHCIGNTELTEALNTILMIVKTVPMDPFASYRADLVQELEKLLEDKKPYIDSYYPEGSFIPTYKDEECVIALFELHAYLQELEHFIAKKMKDGLKFEDYLKCISIATALKEYCWVLMVQMKENQG